jgi:N6-adenosine-specific RNA methylase IME4
VSRIQSHRWQLVSSVEEEVFEQILARARDSQNEITTAAVIKLAKKIRAEQSARGSRTGGTCTVEDLGVLVSREARFSTVYADPPWRYGNQGTRAATDNHYVTMTVEEIAALPVAGLVADDAHLHLWTTNAFLFDARSIIEAWGFEYKSCFVWVKPEMGIGNYWRVSHEFMLLGVRGRCPFLDKSQMSWIQASRTHHSAKPGGVRSIIEAVSPGPYLELFGRDAVEGWTVWGNEVSRGLFTYGAERATK